MESVRTTRSGLCPVCEKLPLGDWGFPICPELPLGRFGEVRSRSCPLCELVTWLCLSYPTSCSGIPLTDVANITIQYILNHGIAVNHAVLGTYLCAAVKPAPGVEDRAYARADLPGFIDFGEIGRWIAECGQEHGSRCRSVADYYNPELLPRNSNRQLDLRLIDTQSMCLIYARRGCQYVALSYVWGSRALSRLALISDNQEALMVEGALSRPDLQAMIPQTIQDAICVAQKLGQRYLWVDSLCLVQDDEDELADCIAIMDCFYQMATLTIVAADGDAWSGLPGVQLQRRGTASIVREVMPGYKLTTVADLDAKLRGSAYNSRAWTMQEETLSNRLLVFVDGQVFFQCQEASCSEVRNWPGRSIYLEPKEARYSQIFGRRSTFADFTQLVKYYMSRDLSFQNDVHRAAQGMLRKFSILSEVHCLEGLPGPIDRSLLFRASQRRFSQAVGRRKGFPSYSWTGWYSSPDYASDNPGGDLRLLEIRGIWRDPEWYCAPWAGLSIWIKWFCIRVDAKLCSVDMAGRMLRKSELPSVQDSLKDALPALRTVPVSTADIEIAAIPSIPYTGLLFWTVCVNLSIIERWEHEGCFGAKLKDHYGNDCGVINLDMEVPDSEGTFAILACTTTMFFALMIRWSGNVAERCGRAEIPLDILNRSLSPGLHWKLIVLQ